MADPNDTSVIDQYSQQSPVGFLDQFATPDVPVVPRSLTRKKPADLVDPTAPVSDDFGAQLQGDARTVPSVIPKVGPFALTKTQLGPTVGGINPTGPPSPSYLQASIDPSTGQPSAANPSLTKLGKVLTILRGAGMGALAGGTQPDFFHGAMAAQQNRNQQIQQFQEQQKRAVDLEQARQNLQYVQTPWGNLPPSLAKVLLPVGLRGEYSVRAADVRADAMRDVAESGAISKENVARLNNWTKMQVLGMEGTPLTPEMAKEFGFPPQFIGKRVRMQDITSARNASARATVPMFTEDGLVTVDKAAAAEGRPSVRIATDEEGHRYQSASLLRPTVVGGENGDTYYATAGQAERGNMTAPGSASVTVPRKIIEGQIPKNAGDLIVGFKTMVNHADLLRTAMQALQNGDVQAWNKIKNDWKTAFGYSGKLTAEAIADAYKGEVSSVINKGHITDTGSEKVAHTLDPEHMNYDTMDSVLAAYQALALSKMNNLNDQIESARQQAQRQQAQPQNGRGAPATRNVSPTTHQFNVALWRKKYPGKDPSAIIAKAKKQGLTIVGQ